MQWRINLTLPVINILKILLLVILGLSKILTRLRGGFRRCWAGLSQSDLWDIHFKAYLYTSYRSCICLSVCLSVYLSPEKKSLGIIFIFIIRLRFWGWSWTTTNHKGRAILEETKVRQHSRKWYISLTDWFYWKSGEYTN